MMMLSVQKVQYLNAEANVVNLYQSIGRNECFVRMMTVIFVVHTSEGQGRNSLIRESALWLLTFHHWDRCSFSLPRMSRWLWAPDISSIPRTLANVRTPFCCVLVVVRFLNHQVIIFPHHSWLFCFLFVAQSQVTLTVIIITQLVHYKSQLYDSEADWVFVW